VFYAHTLYYKFVILRKDMWDYTFILYIIIIPLIYSIFKFLSAENSLLKSARAAARKGKGNPTRDCHKSLISLFGF
jgi:hypothetical protein